MEEKMSNYQQKITPYLWFDNQAEEAMNFYTSLFNDSKIVAINRLPEGFDEGPMAGMEGKVIHGLFELAGYQFMAWTAVPSSNSPPLSLSSSIVTPKPKLTPSGPVWLRAAR
jgi:predicted 3-demethylubiquinone-9 3-methyltransferase (glyoxalase superfamily)